MCVISLPKPFERTLKRLRKLVPNPNKRMLHIVQHHLRAVKPKLDLRNPHKYRTFWVLWLTQFQGVLLAFDLLRSKREKDRKRKHELDAHRGRVTVKVFTDGLKKKRSRSVIRLRPHKIDQAGDQWFVKTFVVDIDDKSLSVGEAIFRIL